MTHSEGSVTSLIRDHFAGSAYVVLSQVRNTTGYGPRQRTADAVVMSLWPSRGLTLSGFEIKVARADWKKELAEPAKAEEISRFCDRWYIAAPPKVVELAELPPTWGFYEVGEQKLKLVKEAAIAKEVQPISRGFLGALLRAATESTTPKAEVQREVARRVDAEVEQAVERALRGSAMKNLERRLEFAQRDLETLRGTVRAFEEAAGVSLSDWRMGEVGNAVRAIQARGPESLAIELSRQAAGMRAAAELAESGAKELRALVTDGERSAAE